jgi:hypothetical protein
MCVKMGFVVLLAVGRSLVKSHRVRKRTTEKVVVPRRNIFQRGCKFIPSTFLERHHTPYV